MHSTLVFSRREHCGLCGRFQRLRRDLANKAIPSPAQSFNKARFLWAVVERATDFPYRSIQALIEIDEYIGRPKLRLYLLPRDYEIGRLQQIRQSAKGTLFPGDPVSVFP